MAKTKSYTAKGLKALLSLVAFVATFYFSFKWANQLIHWIASAFQNHDAQFACVIVLWLVGFSVILGIAFGLSALVTRIVMSILGVD